MGQLTDKKSRGNWSIRRACALGWFGLLCIGTWSCVQGDDQRSSASDDSGYASDDAQRKGVVDAHYADGTVWEPVVPLSPGRISPRSMDDRQWATFVAQSGIQADRNVRTFTPAWTGFSADPSGDLSYMDFGALVVLWSEADLQGTSNQDFMTITNLPSAIRPSATRLIHCGALRDDAGSTATLTGHVSVLSTGVVHFALDDTTTVPGLVVANPNFWTALGTKGLKGGWLIMYAK